MKSKVFSIILCLLMTCIPLFSFADSTSESAIEFDEPVLISANTRLLSVSPSETSGLKAILLEMFGDYDTVITDYEYRSGSSSYTSHSIDIQYDIPWIASALVFSVVFVCIFRFVFIIFKNL